MTDKSRQVLTVVTVAIAIFMTNLDTSIVNIAMPTLARYFNADTDDVSRVILTYLLAMVSFLFVFGKISDMKGPERIFALGYAVFTLASVLCAFAPSLAFLNLFRFIQGLGGAMLLATWGAIAVKYLPAEIRGRAFGMVTVFGGVGMAIGAPVGGLLITWLSWKWVFLINLPVGIIALILIKFVLHPDVAMKDRTVKFDYPGSALSLTGLFCLFLLLNKGQDDGWLSLRPIILAAVTVISFTAFYFRERSFGNPILDLHLLKKKHLLFGYATTFIATMILMGFNFLFPFFFDLVRHLDPDRTGLLLMIFPLTSILVSPVSGYFSDKTGSQRVSLIALVLITVSTFLFAFFGIGTNWWFIIAAFLVLGTGLSLFFTANTALIMSHAIPGKESMFSASIATITYLGSAIGINIFENVFSFGFQGMSGKEVLDTIAPDTIVNGFLHASVFAVIIAAAGIVTTMLSRENKLIPYPTSKDSEHERNKPGKALVAEPCSKEDLVQ